MNLAIIPARGGSKRIPRENIKPFCGKPMIAWSIEVLEGLRSHGVGANLYHNPIRLHLRYRRQGFQPSDFPISESYYEEAPSLPMFPVWKKLELADVARTLAALTGAPK